LATFDLTITTSASLHQYGEPNEFVSGYVGTVTCTDDETGEVTKVGKVTALRVHAALAQDAGEPLLDVCDAHSAELLHLYALLYEPDSYQFREKLLLRYEAIQSDLLVLDYVVLNPKWRGLKLGLLAVRRAVDLLGGGCGLAVSLIAPLRHDAAGLLGLPGRWIPRQANKVERQDARVRLRRYFRTMGFERLGRTPYYALALNLRNPSAAELLGGTPSGA
jgi:hypothetical protein